MVQSTTKIQWADWMKVFAMLFVIWGHCFPYTMSAFIYAFNVPVFFLISGFLTKEKDNSGKFYNKFLHNLLIPYLLLAFLKGAGSIIKGVDNGEWYITVGAILGGFHTIDGIQGCSNLWFVYSLMIVRLIHHFVKGNRNWLVGLSLLSITTIYLLNRYIDLPNWAVTDALIALPFFTIGHLLRTIWWNGVERLINKIKSARTISLVGAFAILAVAVYFIGEANGSAKLYAGNYGNSIFLLFLGALIGSAMLMIPSVALDCKQPKFLVWLAAGNIVTLTFHREILHTPLKMIRNSDLQPWFQDICTFLISCATLACFIPICWIIVKYLPIFIGKRGNYYKNRK